jgi:hypothetical protein
MSGSDTFAGQLRRWLGSALCPGRRPAATPPGEALGTMCFGPLDQRGRLGLHELSAGDAGPDPVASSEDPGPNGATRPG